MGGTSCNDLARTQTLSADWGAITCQSHIQGQLGTVTDPSEGVTGYHYDPAGNCDRADYPNGDVITRVYDIVGHDDLAGTRSYRYDGGYRLTKVTRPDGSNTEYW